jgi:hypothetical protein
MGSAGAPTVAEKVEAAGCEVIPLGHCAARNRVLRYHHEQE